MNLILRPGMTDDVIDVSHDQPDPFDAAAIAAAGVTTVMAKASQNRLARDVKFARRRPLLAAAGVRVIPYHFLGLADPEMQAANFIDAAKIRAGDVVMVDWEFLDAEGTLWPRRAIAEAFVAAIERQTGVWPILYFPALFAEALATPADSLLTFCPAALADISREPTAPAGWRERVVYWQHRWDGTCPGITGKVDRSIKYNYVAARLSASLGVDY